MNQYIFLLRVDPRALTQDQLSALGTAWKGLITQWSAEGRFITNYRFNLPGTSVSGRPEKIVPGNYVYENDLALTGCVILLAKDLPEATVISRSFPTLDIGGSIEIREIQSNTFS